MSGVAVPYVNLALQHKTLKKPLLAAMEKVLDHGCFIMGPEVQAFEERFAAYCGAAQAVGVDNGTSALFLTLRALEIGPGDEVITAPNSFLASASCIALAGARPVFADVGEDCNLNPELVEEAITARTRAVIPVHLTGRPAEMDTIMDIARRHGLHVIEDCAQAVGARYRGQHVGTFGAAGCFSLHPLKTLNAIGDGGVILTNDKRLSKRLRVLRNHGLRNRDECVTWSPNCRLDTLQAAALLVKMDFLDQWTEKRRAIAAFYQESLANVTQVPRDKPQEYAVYHTFVIQSDRRDELQKHLLECGAESKVHYPIPIHLQEAAAGLGYGRGSFPQAERQSKRILSLPVYPELTQEQSRLVADGIRGFFGSSRLAAATA